MIVTAYLTYLHLFETLKLSYQNHSTVENQNGRQLQSMFKLHFRFLRNMNGKGLEKAQTFKFVNLKITKMFLKIYTKPLGPPENK